MTWKAAESLGISALAFLAQDRGRLARFLALTGLAPERLIEKASAPETLIAVLEHMLADESLLLSFAANAGVRPIDIAPALSALSEHARHESCS
jgi:hypothetical protein